MPYYRIKIEDYKNKDVIEEGNKVKSITYKMIE